MQRTSLYFTVSLFAALMCGLSGCKKINGIDNNQVIEAPYSLYYTDLAGTLFVTNDGRDHNKVVFHTDGTQTRAMFISGNNVLWAKNNLYISSNGINFNHAYDSLRRYRTATVLGDTIDLNQSMIAHVPEWNMDFAASGDADPTNFTGVVFSNQTGVSGSWWLEPNPAPSYTVIPTPSIGRALPRTITSFTKLKHDTLCGYDAIHNRNFFRTQNSTWYEVTANPIGPYFFFDFGDPNDVSGTGDPLPVLRRQVMDPVTLEMPGTDSTYEHFAYGHYNNRLIAICRKGDLGAWYSDNVGRDWVQYTGLPASTPLNCIASPFEQVCLIGSANGLFILNVNTGIWQKCNNGLASNIVVRNITWKENFFKNGTSQKYIYIATNQGIYQSKDMAANWVLTIPGNFVMVY